MGGDETAGEVLRRRYGELGPDAVRRNADYLSSNVESRPWLKAAMDADPLVQACYVDRDQSGGHELRRHEGWRGEEGQADRAALLRDPAHAADDAAYLRSADAYGHGRLHECGRYSTHIPDPVAYATAMARISEHAQVRGSLDGQFDAGQLPKRVRDIPIEDVLGPDGHQAAQGFRLVGEDWKAALDQREDWARAVRAELDNGVAADEAISRIRSSAAAQGRIEPSIERIPTFEGGTFVVQFGFNKAMDGYEILSLQINPPQESA